VSAIPVFTIKAKDALAIEAIREYQAICRSRGLFEQAEQVELAIREMVEWRRENLTLLKMPDHEHVSAVAGNAERLARAFHEAYEELAPSFGYETREASAKPWDQVPEQNRNLMIAVCRKLISDGEIIAP
jgi:hypothetical protein